MVGAQGRPYVVPLRVVCTGNIHDSGTFPCVIHRTYDHDRRSWASFPQAHLNSSREAVSDSRIRPDVAMAARPSLGAGGLDLAAQVGDVGTQDLGVVGVARAPHRGEELAVG